MSESLKRIWDTGLTKQEVGIIGEIVVQWGALEFEVFEQTLMTFGTDIHLSQLPKEMNNLNFSSVLKLWKERVVEQAEGDVKKVLEGIYDKILEIKDIRNAIVHGMWDFSTTELQTVSTLRVRKDQIIHSVFKDQFLVALYEDIAELNFNIRYPGGLEKFLQEQMSDGFYVNKAEIRRMKLDAEKS